MRQNRVVIGITGASGVIYGVRLLELLKREAVETHLICSKNSQKTLALETEFPPEYVSGLADFTYECSDMAAPVASGSFKTMGMIIAPCSMKTLAEIANGISNTLISRAADVILKERRRLILLTRESPLHAIHLKNMLTVTENGGIILPPVPSFYTHPKNLDDLINATLGRAMDLLGLDNAHYQRWGEPQV